MLIGDGRCKNALVARSQREGLGNCLFLPPVRKTEIPCITASFDCGLMILADVPTFYYCTSPNKFFDYISAGIPVVTNYPGWLADLIGEHRCSVAVGPRSPAGLAAALINLADDRNLCEIMGHNARRLAEQRFNRASLADHWATLLETTSRCPRQPNDFLQE